MASKSARLAEARCRCRSPASSVVGDDDDDSSDALVLGATVLCNCRNCDCFAKRRDEDDDANDALVEHCSSARRVSISDDRSASKSKVFHLVPRRSTARESSYLERGELRARLSASNHLILFFTKK